MSDTTAPHVADTVARYVRFWNTPPEEQRRTGREIFTVDSTYVAPAGVLRGVEALAEFTEQFVGNVGDYEFRARTEPDMHHHRARLPWEIRVGETSFAEGTDVISIGDDGRITSVATFVDRAPRPPAHHGRPQNR
ncbi:isomerase [Georgenia sp. H159]|uniref:isomerase n=1 Tax=Georgenia sp. H159 TaxID=3076115 RepID=UPI002D78E491|nr:isomerase [Georgenia sp. H159]